MGVLRQIAEVAVALVSVGTALTLIGIAYGYRQRLGERNVLLEELYDELVANRRKVTAWWRGELGANVSHVATRSALVTALRPDAFRAHRPREWERLLGDAQLAREIAAFYDALSVTSAIVSSDWEDRFDELACRVRQRMRALRWRGSLVLRQLRLPENLVLERAAPPSPAEMQRRALERLPSTGDE